ncbi:MAG: ATP-grasp domain-containing protein [Verrucomicrobia subdivision 3 bacterium]|nr:ATP-grasp domain-containing protein [Limisphaerales bacterium]
MPTLLLSARQTDDAQLLWRTCIKANWDVVRVHGWQVPSLPANDVVVYGEPLFAQHVAQILGLRLVEPSLDWLPRLSARWRGRDVRLTTLADARKVADRAFIKPADEKSFDARVYSSGAELPTPGPLPEDLPVLVQEVVEWTIEFRCFVLERKVAAVSAYWRDGKLAKSDDDTWIATDAELNEATQFCESVLRDPSVSVPDAVVLDLGVIRNRGWAVVECNAAFASGIYGCDPTAVLNVLRRACMPVATNANNTVTLFRPVGPKELELIRASGNRLFPPRLPEQPIFYPVLNEEYAVQIARDWNVKESGAGYVTRFRVRKEFVEKYPVQTVGNSTHKELWIPAEDLHAFNDNIVGEIEVIATFPESPCK